MPDEEQGYIAYDSRWTLQECPQCKQPATAHGWLFEEPPPRTPLDDKRKAIAEMFQHADANLKDRVLRRAE